MFNHRFPSVPAVSLDALAEALRSPQKAAEILDAWKVAQAAYEASKADYEAVKAEWVKNHKALEADRELVEIEWSELFQAQKLFKDQKAHDLEALEQAKKRLAAQGDAIGQQNEQLVQYDTALRAREAKLEADAAKVAKTQAENAHRLEAWEADLVKQGNELLLREEKADKIAALLKGV